MNGTIHYCLEETIKKKHGLDAWKACLKEAGLSTNHSFGQSILKDLDEAESLQLFSHVATALQLSLKEVFDDFGEHWSCVYASKMYPQFFESAKSTKTLLLNLDKIHQIVTSKKPGATPPRFNYEWQSEDKLLLHYQSKRGLFDLFLSLLKGLDTYFSNTTIVEQTGENQALLTFQ